MQKLPHWVIPDKFPALYDLESATAIEMTAKVYSAMNGLIDDYNKFVDRINEEIEAFETSSEKNYELFTISLRQEFQDFIDTIELKVKEQDRIIQSAVDYMTTELNTTIASIIEEMRETGKLQEDILLAFDNIDTRVKYLENYVTPKMFGAVGDGEADDTEAIQQAFNSDNAIIFIPKGQYKCSNNLTIPHGKTVIGTNSTEILFSNGFGIITNGRFIIINNLAITCSDSTGTGILFSGEDSHYVTLENVYITGFNKGISNNIFCWNHYYKNVRITLCNIGLDFINKSIPNFNIEATNVYINRCEKTMNINASYINFSSCNFSLNSIVCVQIGVSSNINFTNCNFECDTKIQEADCIFSLSGRNVKFSSCKFLIDAISTAYIFSLYEGVDSVTFENILYSTKTTNELANDNVFNKSQFNSTVGGIKILHGCSSLPRPNILSLPTYKMINFNDIERNLPLQFYQSVDKTKLHIGMILYDLKTNKLGYFNGTDVVSINDNSLIA